MQRRRIAVAVTATLVLAGIVGVAVRLKCRCRAPAEQAPAADVLALVDGHPIRVADFEAAVRNGTRVTPEMADAVLADLITRQAQVCAARQAGIDLAPKVRRALDNVLIGRLRTAELQSRLEAVAVTDQEVAAAYAAQRNQYARPAKVRLAILALTARTTKHEQAVSRLAAARKAALAMPADVVGFGQLAIANSDDQTTRYNGGNAGWITVGQHHPKWPAEVVAAAGALTAEMPLSEVVETDDGVYLLKLIDRREASLVPLDDVAARIRHKLLREKRARTEERFVEDLRAHHPATVVTENVERLKARLPTGPAPAEPAVPEVPRH